MLPATLLSQPFAQINAWLAANKELALQSDLLHQAVQVNRFSLVVLLLHNGFDINALDSKGKTPLHYAAQDSERTCILNFLLARRAQLIADFQGNNQLHEATAYNSAQALQSLIKHFKKPNLTTRNHQRQTVVQIAISNHFLDSLVVFLESYSSEVDLDELALIRDNQDLPQGIRNRAFLSLVARGKVDVIPEDYHPDLSDSMGNNSNLLAVGSGQPEALAALIQAGYDLLTINNTEADFFEKAITSGQLPMLQLLTRPKDQGGYGLSFDALFSADCRYYDTDEFVDERDLHPLFLAVAYGHEQILKLLVSPKEQDGYGIALDTEINGFNAPVIAAAWNQISMFKLLVSDQPGGYAMPLSQATKAKLVLAAIGGGHLDMLRMLTQPRKQGGYGLSLDVRDGEGYCPVLTAIHYGQTEMLIKLLLPVDQGGYGLSLNTQNEEGNNPVIVAIEAAEMTILQLLLLPVEFGGYGLSITGNEEHILKTILTFGNTSLLKLFLRPLEQDGYGLILENPLTLLVEVEKESMFAFVFLNEFQRLQKISCDAALAWIKAVFNKYPNEIRKQSFSNQVIPAYSQWLSDAIVSARCEQQGQTNTLGTLLKIIQGHHEFMPMGHFELANWYRDTHDYIYAFKEYQKIFNFKLDTNAQAAGYELASLILAGKVLLKADGTLDEKNSQNSAQVDMPEQQIDAAIKAYEYLQDDTTCELRQLLDVILANKPSSSSKQQEMIWPSQVLIKYQNYYIQRKNFSMLAQDMFVRSASRCFQIQPEGPLPSLKQQFKFATTTWAANEVNELLLNLLVVDLHQAILISNKRFIKLLLAGDQDLYEGLIRNFLRDHQITYSGDFLINTDQLLNTKTPDGNTALHHVVKKSDKIGMEILDLFLCYGVNLTSNEKGNTPLHNAAVCNNLLAVRRLLSYFKKPDLNIRNSLDQTVLDIALANSNFDLLKELLECYDADINLNELISLRDNTTLPINIRHTAFLALVVRGKLDFFPADYNQNFRDTKGNDAILLAVRGGHSEILAILIKAGYTLQTRNLFQVCPVLMAIAQGHENLFKLLIMPKEQGGYELTVNTCDITGYCPVLKAVAYGQAAILARLIRPQEQDGCGLSLGCVDKHGNDPINVAVAKGQIPIFDCLVKPTELGGYGLQLKEPAEKYLMRNKDKLATFECIFYYELLQRKQVSCEKALAWINHICLSYLEGPASAIFRNNLKTYFKHWLVEIITLAKNTTKDSAEVLSNLEKILQVYEIFAPGEGHFQLANAYLETNDFTNAFNYYLDVFSNDESVCKAQAGYQLADLIFTSNVLLNNKGILIDPSTDVMMQDESTVDSQHRAIMALEYLWGNREVHADALRTRLANILSGEPNLTTSQELVCWQPSVLSSYQNYYLERQKYEMLAEAMFVLSAQHCFRQATPQQAVTEVSYAITTFFESATTRNKSNTPCERPDFSEQQGVAMSKNY